MSVKTLGYYKRLHKRMFSAGCGGLDLVTSAWI